MHFPEVSLFVPPSARVAPGGWADESSFRRTDSWNVLPSSCLHDLRQLAPKGRRCGEQFVGHEFDNIRQEECTMLSLCGIWGVLTSGDGGPAWATGVDVTGRRWLSYPGHDKTSHVHVGQNSGAFVVIMDSS